MMKKFLFLIVLLFLINLNFEYVSAKTMNDLYNEMEGLKQEKQDNINKKELNADERANTIDEISSLSSEIDNTLVEIAETKEKIVELNVEIVAKEEETDLLLRNEQISSGNMEYLEYLFSSKDLADFIQRLQIVETLSNHNKEVIEEMETLINENEALEIELQTKHSTLLSQQRNMNYKLNTLNTEAEEIAEISVDIDEEIDDLKELIKFYEDHGCDGNDDLDVCTNQIPPDNEFWRPVTSGLITSLYGWRVSPTSGKWSFHYGVDLGYLRENMSKEINVYASANGKVINTTKYNCGGKTVYVAHYVNGIKYTTVYMHLRSIYVSVGQSVTSDTVIGLMGGNSYNSSLPGYTPWDPCSTGRHLHFGLAIGEHRTYTSYKSGSINPAGEAFVNFPSYRVVFSKRNIYY